MRKRVESGDTSYGNAAVRKRVAAAAAKLTSNQELDEEFVLTLPPEEGAPPANRVLPPSRLQQCTEASTSSACSAPPPPPPSSNNQSPITLFAVRNLAAERQFSEAALKLPPPSVHGGGSSTSAHQQPTAARSDTVVGTSAVAAKIDGTAGAPTSAGGAHSRPCNPCAVEPPSPGKRTRCMAQQKTTQQVSSSVQEQKAMQRGCPPAKERLSAPEGGRLEVEGWVNRSHPCLG